jgi:hypothetical protein
MSLLSAQSGRSYRAVSGANRDARPIAANIAKLPELLGRKD